jgi:hypothetical protein
MTQILLVIATSNTALGRIVEQRRAQIVPEIFRRNSHKLLGGARLVVSCFMTTLGASPDHLLRHIEERMTDETVGLIILAEQQLQIIDHSLTDLCFVTEYTLNGTIKSPQNFLNSFVSRALNCYIIFAGCFDDLKFRKIFTLPLRNFKATELTTLRQICSNPIVASGFSERMEEALKRLRGRQQPKRYTDSSVMYIVDDKGKNFQFGNEIHARADTKTPPHNKLCILPNRFSFGRRFDNERHYNVSAARKGEEMNGIYLNRHSEPTSGKGRTHLNMFPNDFF